MKVLSAIAGIVFAGQAGAAIDTYTDRTAWEATLPGGTPQIVENFEGFTQDTEFRSGPLSIAVGSIAQVGVDTGFRNEVDVAPFQFTDNNGTTHASCFVNFPEGGNAGTNVEISFDQPVSSWGADFEGVLGGEFLVVAIDANGSELGTISPPSNTGVFMGFTATAGEQVTKVILRSQTLNPGGAGEGFGMDNIGIARDFGEPTAVPTMHPIGLMILVGLVGWITRRRFGTNRMG